MNVVLTFKKFEPSVHLREYAQKRFGKLNKFLHKTADYEIGVVLSLDKYRHKADVKLTGDDLNLSAIEESEDMYVSIDRAFEKIVSQLKKQLEIRKDKRRRATPSTEYGLEVFQYHPEGEREQRKIVGVDKFETKPLYDDEAAMQLEQRGDEFMVFLNAETKNINVIYRRKNGDFGLIDVGV